MPTDPLDAITTADPLDNSGVVAFAPFLVGTGQTGRVTRSDDGAGGQSESWATVATLACRVWSTIEATEGVEAGRVAAVTTWHAMVPLGSDVRPADRFTTGGVAYEVTDTDAGRTDALALTLQIRRVT